MTSQSSGRDWLFGYPTATIDRFSPGVEEVYLPASTSLEGELEIELNLGEFEISRASELPRLSRFKLAMSKDYHQLGNDQIGIDLRINSSLNWAHAITNHLPLSLLIKSQLKDIDKTPVVIFPANISRKIVEIFELSGFPSVTTHAPVLGYICKFSLTPWISIRGERCQIIRDGLQGSELQKKLSDTETTWDRIFLSRRKTRTISNEKEIKDYLEKLGFKTIYAEDYSALDQLAYIISAKEIISVHGAALGPLILKSAFADSMPYKLIEIFSPAHVGTAWRLFASQQNSSWAGVRGRVWPELLMDGADFVRNMENFEVSIDCLQSALSYLEIDQ